jgi:hypothetical protein
MKMSRLAFAALLLLATAPLALAQGTYTQIDYPGSIYTEVWGVDAAGDVSGFYEDVVSVWHGYLLSGGVYTEIDYPGAPGTFLYDMNDVGQVVGETSSRPFVGFLYDIPTRTFVELTCNGSDVVPDAINNAGVIAGFTESEYATGFTLAGSQCRTTPPVGTLSVYVSGIAASNDLVGYMRSNSRQSVSFLYTPDGYARIAIPNATRVVVQGINPAGNLLAGYYSASPAITAGFVYDGRRLTTLRFPGSNYTSVASVSSNGEAVGTFSDTSGFHGFTWTPPADAGKK